jgi:endoribonuclease Dicer
MSKVSLFIYKVECENIGFSKDPLLTETSNYAILFGQELNSEVLTMSMDLFVARTMTTRASLAFCGTIEMNMSEVLSC